METELLKTCTCASGRNRSSSSWRYGYARARLPVRMGLAIVILSVLLTNACCFNLDVRTRVVHKGTQNGSRFGFSVAQHIEGENSWLLVGAPKADTSQPDLTRPGALYKCGINRTSSCSYVEVDKFGNNVKLLSSRNEYKPLENKSDQWLGATLLSSGPDGRIIICAPRYVYFSQDLNKREPVGHCYYSSKNFEQFLEVSPCRQAVDLSDIVAQYHRQGSCSAGNSIDVRGDYMFMGAPGSYYWQGQIFSYEPGRPGSYMRQTGEFQPEDDNQQLGMSLMSGEFDGEVSLDIVTGAPRAGFNRVGLIALYTQEMIQLLNISGDQMGAGFGMSVAAVDLNNDGLDDILVGSPLYSDFEKNMYEIGRVFVFYQDTNHHFSTENMEVLEGSKKYVHSRFGFSIALADDLNQDGYKDIAIGAPFEGEGQQGAVYIFHGGQHGINTTAQQVIHGADINSEMKSFGYSISGGYDLDKNHYPDLLVGAMASDQVVYLRTRPIVSMEVSLNAQPRIVKLDQKACQLEGVINVTCLTMDTCFKYKVIDGPNRIRVNLKWELDSQKIVKRAFLRGEPTETVFERKNQILRKGRNHCYPVDAYIKDGIRDKLSDIVFDFSYELVNREIDFGPDDLMPVLNQYQSATVQAAAQIWKDCGPDNICIPDLRVTAFSMTPLYELGSKEDIIVSVDVTNLGDGAHGALFLMSMPSGVKYLNIYDVKSETPITCTKLDEDVSCDIGNPVKAGESVQFKVLMRPEKVNGSSPFLKFYLQANSTNPENLTTVHNNRKEVDIPVKFRANFKFGGVSLPEQVEYSLNGTQIIQTESDIGPNLTHLYEVINNGPSNISVVEVVILWPSKTTTDEHMLYLLEDVQVVGGNGECVTPNVNSENITLETYNVNTQVDAVVTLDGLSRKKRAIAAENKDVKTIDCSGGWCDEIKCTVRDLNGGQNTLIKIRSRVWSQTLVKAGYRDLILVSKGTAVVKEVPYKVKPERVIQKSFQIDTLLHSDSIPETKPLQWWWILIAVAGGIFLLIILVVILWKCGFFRRKRIPDDEDDLMERETMQVERKHANGGTVDDDEV